jgi:hypothetical protein
LPSRWATRSRAASASASSPNDFGGAATTIHLHFEIKATVALPDGTSQIHFAPPYASLVDSYKRLLKGTP